VLFLRLFNFEFILTILCINVSFHQKDESIRERKHEAKKVAMRNFNRISVVHIFITKGFPYLAELQSKEHDKHVRTEYFILHINDII